MKNHRSYFKCLANTITGSCAVAARWGYWQGAFNGMKAMVAELPADNADPKISVELISVGTACGDCEEDWSGTKTFPAIMAGLLKSLASTSPRDRFLIVKDEEGEWSWCLACPANHYEWHDQTPSPRLVQFIRFGR